MTARLTSASTATSSIVSRVMSECTLLKLAVGMIALHIADDNFLQPQPGTAAADHLVSGLVPVGILIAAAAMVPYFRPGPRAGAAMTLGALGVTTGVPSLYYLLKGHASGDHYSGLVAIAFGFVLIAVGCSTLWRARRVEGSRSRRYLRRAQSAVVGLLAGMAAVWFLVFPIGFSYIYSHTGGGAVTPDLGVPYQQVTVRTSDSLELAGTYVVSKNRAAVVLFPGMTRSKEARMLIRHGYGVLLLEPRGEGRSQGDNVRWAGDRDLLAAVRYLRDRPDVDSSRIGGFGFSVGGEMLLEAAAQTTGFKAIVSEGAGGRVGQEDIAGPARILTDPNLAIMTAALSVFSNQGPPPPIVQRIGKIAPRPLLLIYAIPGMGGEDTRQPKYYAAAREPKAIWRVPGSKHTGGIDAQPQEYERRVIAFLDRALLG
jgi:uncharacterized protein